MYSLPYAQDIPGYVLLTGQLPSAQSGWIVAKRPQKCPNFQPETANQKLLPEKGREFALFLEEPRPTP
jgi:hypothetical protein